MHGKLVRPIEIGPHRTAEEIDAIDADRFIEQQRHMRMAAVQPCPELVVLVAHRAPRVVFVVSCDIQDGLFPSLQNLIERAVIGERDDVARQDHDISVGLFRQRPAGTKFEMQIAVGDYFQPQAVLLSGCGCRLHAALPLSLQIREESRE